MVKSAWLRPSPFGLPPLRDDVVSRLQRSARTPGRLVRSVPPETVYLIFIYNLYTTYTVQ